MARTQEDRLFFRPLDFHAVRFDVRIVLERLVDDAAVEGAQRFQFHDVPPAAHLFGGVLRLFHPAPRGPGRGNRSRPPSLLAPRVLLEEQAVGNVLEVREGLALAPDQAAGIVGLHIQQNTFLHAVFFDREGEAQELQQLFQRGFGFGRHGIVDG